MNLRSSDHGLNARTDGEQLAFAQTISPSVLAFSPSPELLSFPHPLERKPPTIPLPAEYGLHMLLFSSDLKPVIIDLNSGKFKYLFVFCKMPALRLQEQWKIIII